MDLPGLAESVRNAFISSSRRNEAGADGKEGGSPRPGVVVDVGTTSFVGGIIPALLEKERLAYSRPEFLYFSEEETIMSSDAAIRPAICPRYPDRLPLNAGYCEIINAGKTIKNEDQGTAKTLTIMSMGGEDAVATARMHESLPVRKLSDEGPISIGGGTGRRKGQRTEAHYFAIFDGHAGTGASLMTSHCLHEHLSSRLSQQLEHLLHLESQQLIPMDGRRGEEDEGPDINSIVVGALERSFLDMDDQIGEEKRVFSIAGGSTALVALIFLGRVFVANAGDSRALLISSHSHRPLSHDFTPTRERKRIQEIAFRQPQLIGSSFSRLQYDRPLTKKDLHSCVHYRDWCMEGWAVKRVEDSDLRQPLISTQHGKSRLLNTLSVSRVLGDHHLQTGERVWLKPLLSSVPEVVVEEGTGGGDLLVLASDGLWEVLAEAEVVAIARSALASAREDDPSRYSVAAQEIALAARGYADERHRWRRSCGGQASLDDITVFVIPLGRTLAAPTVEPLDDEPMITLCSLPLVSCELHVTK